MEKEQKKLLLVAVSVGVFLLVTIAVALIILTPKVQTQQTAFLASPSVYGSSRTGESSAPFQPVNNNTQETNINIDLGKSDLTVEVDENDGNRQIIHIPTPTKPAIPDNQETLTALPAPAPAATAAPAAVQSTQTVQPVKPAVVQPAAVTKPAARTPTPSKTINDYWIQTGAFSARVRAEDAKDILANKGFVSIIENREVNGSLWYRVRLGPYTSEREANYWLALLKEIDGFGESQVRQTVRQQ